MLAENVVARRTVPPDYRNLGKFAIHCIDIALTSLVQFIDQNL
jgi:hypothetical protein